MATTQAGGLLSHSKGRRLTSRFWPLFISGLQWWCWWQPWITLHYLVKCLYSWDKLLAIPRVVLLFQLFSSQTCPCVGSSEVSTHEPVWCRWKRGDNIKKFRSLRPEKAMFLDDIIECKQSEGVLKLDWGSSLKLHVEIAYALRIYSWIWHIMYCITKSWQ